MRNENAYLKLHVPKNGNGHQHPDELDVISLIQKALAFISAFRFILLACMVAGLFTGLFFYFSSPRQLATRLIVRPGMLNQGGSLSNQEEMAIIENWKRLLQKGETEQVARIMHCDVHIVKKLSSISVEEIVRTYVPNNPNGFLINVAVTDTSVLDEIESGIVHGLNNSPFIKEKLETKRKRYVELIAKVKQEVVTLNATKNRVDSLIRTSSSSPASLLVNISGINAEWIALNEKLLGYQEELKFLSGVQVLESFNKGKLSRPGFLKFTFLGLAAGCFSGFVIALFLYALQKMRAPEMSMLHFPGRTATIKKAHEGK